MKETNYKITALSEGDMAGIISHVSWFQIRLKIIISGYIRKCELNTYTSKFVM